MIDLGDGYFTKSYKGFIEDARGAIKKSTSKFRYVKNGY